MLNKEDFPIEIHLYASKILANDWLAVLNETRGVLGLVKLLTNRTDRQPKSGYWGVCTSYRDWHHAVECRENGIGMEKIWAIPIVSIEDDVFAMLTGASEHSRIIIEIIKEIAERYEIATMCDQDGVDMTLDDLDEFYKLVQ